LLISLDVPRNNRILLSFSPGGEKGGIIIFIIRFSERENWGAPVGFQRRDQKGAF